MTRMPTKSIRILVTLALSAASVAAQAPAPKAAGHWEGQLHMGAQEIPMTIDLSKNAAGAWVGTFSVPGSGQTDIPLGNLTADDAAIHFTLSVQEVATFEGKLSADAKSISGTASNSQGSVGFDLTKGGDAKVNLPPASTALPKEFEGRWEGAVNVGGNNLRLAIKLSTGADGKAAASLISIDQGGQEFPATTVGVDGKKLTIEVRPVGGSYSGIMADNGEIVGDWSQGPVKVALVLKKAERP
jgi:hypothetical protein